MATADADQEPGLLALLAAQVQNSLVVLGDWMIFAASAVVWTFRRRPSQGTLLVSANDVGVRSLVVVMITGTFIGMVLAAQAYGEFHKWGLETRLGAIINMSVIRELGPALAGRVGSAIAAELGTMR